MPQSMQLVLKLPLVLALEGDFEDQVNTQLGLCFLKAD